MMIHYRNIRREEILRKLNFMSKKEKYNNEY